MAARRCSTVLRATHAVQHTLQLSTVRYSTRFPTFRHGFDARLALPHRRVGPILSVQRPLSSSPRAQAEAEESVLSALRSVSVGERNIVSAGLVKNLRVNLQHGGVEFTLASGDSQVLERCRQALSAAGLHWLTGEPTIRVRQPTRLAGAAPESKAAQQDGLEGVKHIIAVSSCKGGVGKSTVAANLALALSETSRVGLLDADIYGPSLPTMMVQSNEEWAVTRSSDQTMINPVVLHGVRCMSYGFVAPGTGGKGHGGTLSSLATSQGAAVLRGPIVSKIVTQLATQTEWGELDYLVIDMPPGTGDIPISLSQQLKLDGAVIVTTPQRLAFVDVVKGLEMFQRLKVPILAVVENMAWFDGDDGKRYFPFGRGHKEQLKSDFGISNSITLPISADTSAAGDSGTPLLVAHRQSNSAMAFREAAQVVQNELLADAGSSSRCHTATVKLSDDKEFLIVRFFTASEARQYRIKPRELRRQLRKVDDMLGSKYEELPADLHVVSIHPMGNYAVSILWSDGHDASIYPYEDIERACQSDAVRIEN